MNKHLSQEEKKAITDLWRGGLSVQNTASKLHRDRKTIIQYLRDTGMYERRPYQKTMIPSKRKEMPTSKIQSICWDCQSAISESKCSWVAQRKIPKGAEYVSYPSNAYELIRITSCPNFIKD